MTYSTDPVADAAAYYEPRYKAADAQESAEGMAVEEFLSACQRLDANAIADFAPMTTDWDAVRAMPRAVGAPMPKRVQTLAECMTDSLDNGNGPSTSEVMQLVLILAFSSDEQGNQVRRARQLLFSMATTWASQNVVVED